MQLPVGLVLSLSKDEAAHRAGSSPRISTKF